MQINVWKTNLHLQAIPSALLNYSSAKALTAVLLIPNRILDLKHEVNDSKLCQSPTRSIKVKACTVYIKNAGHSILGSVLSDLL